MKTSIHRMIAAASLVAAAMASVPAIAQAQPTGAEELTGFWMTTPYPELAIRPGETESISLTLRNGNLPPQRASLEVTGVPEGWKFALKGGSREVSAAMVGPDESEQINLELTPPADAAGENFPIEVRARYGDEVATLPLVVRLSEVATGELTLEPELPALRGTTRSTFSFKVKVTNGGAEEGLFNLAASVPEGFQTRFKRGFGSEEITGIPIDAGGTENITLEVIPFRAAAAGQYPVALRVSSGDSTATTELSLDVTGQPEVKVVGPQERLSGEVTAGAESQFAFTLINTGSAPATELKLAATPPSGWSVAFAPEEIATLAPGSTGEVQVKITPSERAIAGDYNVTVRASGGSVSEQVQFRTTVRTSTIWGIAGLGIIAVAALVLFGAVMRYGRR